MSQPSIDDLRTLTAIQSEIASRRAGDPLLQFEPHTGQKPLIDAVFANEHDENWLFAANRVGKSDAGAYIGAAKARFGDAAARYIGAAGSRIAIRDRATSGWVVSPDFPSSRDIVQPKYFDNGFVPPTATHKPFIPEHEIHQWRKDDQILLLKNGSIIGFKSSDSGRTKFQGTEKNWIHFDEEPPEPIYNECVIRVGQTRLVVFGTCTLLPPENQVGGVSWLFDAKIRPWQQKKATNIGIFSASIYQNPHLAPEEIARLESLYPEGSLQRRIRLNGELVAGGAGSRAYGNFDYDLHVASQPEMSYYRPLCWIWDFNVEPMMSLVGQRDGLIFRIYRVLHLAEGNLNEMCDLFKSYYPGHGAQISIYGDARGKDRSHQTKETSYALITRNMEGYPAPVRMFVPEQNPGVIARVNAVNAALVGPQKEVRVSINNEDCDELIKDLEEVKLDKNGLIKKVTNRKDPYFFRTHYSDGLGYWITYEMPVSSIAGSVPAGSRRAPPKPSYHKLGLSENRTRSVVPAPRYVKPFFTS